MPHTVFYIADLFDTCHPTLYLLFARPNMYSAIFYSVNSNLGPISKKT